MHDRHNISLHYVFCSDGRMFRLSPEEQARQNFGKFQEEVDEMLEYMSKIPHSLYAMLLKFTEYKNENRVMIDRELRAQQKDSYEEE